MKVASIFCILALSSLLIGCGTPTKDSNSISWEKAIKMIHSGEIESVSQTHSLAVSLTTKEGVQFKTKEPAIDKVFQEIKECGEPCSSIIKISE